MQSITEVCLADQTAKGYREQHGLPEGTMVPIFVSCPCSKCSLRF